MEYDYRIFGYVAILFSVIYRLPQIAKIYKSKKAGDISKRMYIMHNCSYIFFIIYLVQKPQIDYLLLSYEIMGITQNLIIIGLKIYYKKKETSI